MLLSLCFPVESLPPTYVQGHHNYLGHPKVRNLLEGFVCSAVRRLIYRFSQQAILLKWITDFNISVIAVTYGQH